MYGLVFVFRCVVSCDYDVIIASIFSLWLLILRGWYIEALSNQVNLLLRG